MTTSVISRDLLTRQNTLVSRCVQDSGYNYRKDLTEVFDSVSGIIKIAIPQQLLNGTGLIDDPAAVMEALLLEPKGDEDSNSRLNAASKSTGKVYSLMDLFDQDDCLDDDVSKRQAYGTGASKWLDKTAKYRRNSLSSKPVPVQADTQETFPVSALPFDKNIKPSNEVLEVIRNSMINSLSVSQSQSQHHLVPQGMTATNQVSSLPLFLTICNKAKQFQQANLIVHPPVEIMSQPNERFGTIVGPPDSQTNPVRETLLLQKSNSPPSLIPKWGQDNLQLKNQQVVLGQRDEVMRNELNTNDREKVIRTAFKSANLGFPQDSRKEKVSVSSLENDNMPVAPFVSTSASPNQKGNEVRSQTMSEEEVQWSHKRGREIELLNSKREELVSPTISSGTRMSSVSNGEISDSSDADVAIYPNFATCPATVE